MNSVTFGSEHDRREKRMAEVSVETGYTERGDSRPPKFNERLLGIWAGEQNPHRVGFYIETIVRDGRLNPGTWYRLTNATGDFWEYEASATLYVPPPVEPAASADDEPEPTEAQNEQFLKECLAAAIQCLRKHVGDEQVYSLDERVDWNMFRTAMDEARDTVRTMAKNRYVDELFICATALYAMLNDVDENAIAPYSVAALHLLAFGRWMILVDSRINAEMAEIDGLDTLGEFEEEESGDEGEKA